MPSISGTIYATNGGVIPVSEGGTGSSTLTANNVLLGNGTSALQVVAPGTNGNVLTSNGTTWTSTAPVVGSLTLLATLTTTSGTTQVASSLPTTYNSLMLVFVGVGNSTGADTFLLEASSTNGAAYGASYQVNTTQASFQQPVYGSMIINAASVSTTNHPIAILTSTARAPSSLTFVATSTAAAINALRFSWGTGYTFNAGTIYVYGWN
jgi:hypothetical protein